MIGYLEALLVLVMLVYMPICVLSCWYTHSISCRQCGYSDYRAVDASVSLLRMLPRDA